MGNDKVEAVLENPATAPIAEPLRATLGLLKKVTQAHGEVTAKDIEPLLALKVTRSQIQDALAVCWCFNVITRLADTFKFEVGPQAAFDAGAKSLLGRGYNL
jgi:alkylhydroperoxidase family enzyme